MREKKNCIIMVDDSFEFIEYANKHILEAEWCTYTEDIDIEQIAFFKSFSNVIIAFGGDDSIREKANQTFEILTLNNINCYMLKYEVLEHPVNFKEPMQRRFVMNQIKTFISKL